MAASPKLLFTLVAVMLLSACQSANKAVGTYFKLDTDLKVEFAVDADINPDEDGRASPLFVRMYELKTNKMIHKVDFIELYERDKEALGADIVNVHRLKRFAPGESRVENFVLDKGTNYVAFYAEFLDYENSKYKVVVPVVANNVFRTYAMVRLAGNTLRVEDGAGKELDEKTEERSSGASFDAKKVEKLKKFGKSE